MITLRQARQLAQWERGRIPKDFPVFGGVDFAVHPCGCVGLWFDVGYIVWNSCSSPRGKGLHTSKSSPRRKRIATHVLFALSAYYPGILSEIRSGTNKDLGGRYFYFKSS